MMDFTNPHAILIKPENFEEIMLTVYVSGGTAKLMEQYVTSVNEDMRAYVVAWRNSVTGLPVWMAYTEVELACEYRLKTVNQFWDHFTKL